MSTSSIAAILGICLSIALGGREDARVYGRSIPADSVVIGVFEGRTPCGEPAVAFTGFPAANCEKIKWELTLYAAGSSRRPAGYVYRGTRSTKEGTWSIGRGTAADPTAVVYTLHYDAGRTLHLLRADENVLLLLGPDLTLLVGDASWSYTLSRTDRRK
jgi:hypothetical protein